MQEQVHANKRRAVVLLGAFAGAVFVLVWVVGLLVGLGAIGVVLAALVAGGASAAAWWKATDLALALTHVRPADPRGHARLFNLVDGLCVAAGLPHPDLHVVDDDAPNAFAVGRSPRRAAVVVTTGLLEKLTRIELEGVLAHELSHVKSYDTLPSTLAVAVVALPLHFAGPLAGKVVPRAVSPRRELLADASAVSLTRYPPGLISALEKVRADGGAVHAASRATAHLWLESPIQAEGSGAPRGAGRTSDTHPPLDERIAALREL